MTAKLEGKGRRGQSLPLFLFFATTCCSGLFLFFSLLSGCACDSLGTGGRFVLGVFRMKAEKLARNSLPQERTQAADGRERRRAFYPWAVPGKRWPSEDRRERERSGFWPDKRRGS